MKFNAVKFPPCQTGRDVVKGFKQLDTNYTMWYVICSILKDLSDGLQCSPRRQARPRPVGLSTIHLVSSFGFGVCGRQTVMEAYHGKD